MKKQEHMENEHASGALCVSGPEEDCLTVYIDTQDGSPVCAMNGFRGDSIANARRLVAAWNACDDIETVSLEAGGAGWLKTSILRAGRQRDELIEALKAIQQRANETRTGENAFQETVYELYRIASNALSRLGE